MPPPRGTVAITDCAGVRNSPRRCSVVESARLPHFAPAAGEQLGNRAQGAATALVHTARRASHGLDFQCPTKSNRCDTLAPVVPVDEEAPEAVIGPLVETCVVLLRVVNVRKRIGGAVFAPRHRNITVEDQGRVRLAFSNETLFVGAVALRSSRRSRCTPDGTRCTSNRSTAQCASPLGGGSHSMSRHRVA